MVCFSKHTYHVQGEIVLLECFLKPYYIGQTVGGEWDVTDLIGKAGEPAAIQSGMETWLRKGSDEKFLSEGHMVKGVLKEFLETT